VIAGRELASELLKLGIPRSVYEGRRARGLDHDQAIADCLARKKRKPRNRNALDVSMTNTAELLRKWRR
jgi:hypothetical protein